MCYVIIGTQIMRVGIGTIAASVILCVALYCVASVGIRNVVLEIASPALRQLDRNKTEY